MGGARNKTQSIELLTEAGALPLSIEVVADTVDYIVAAMEQVASPDGVVISRDTASGHTGFWE